MTAERRREQLLTVALRLFNDLGFDGASTRAMVRHVFGRRLLSQSEPEIVETFTTLILAGLACAGAPPRRARAAWKTRGRKRNG